MTDLKLEVYDTSLELVDALTGVESIVWQEEAFGAGSFTAVTFLTEESAALLKPEHYLWIADDTVGLIESVELTAEENGVKKLTAKGRTGAALFDRRILWGTYNVTGTPAAVMAHLVSDCCVTPTRGTTAARILPILDMDNTPQGGSSIRLQKTGGSLLEALEGLGEAYQVPYKVALDPVNSRLLYTSRYGVDRSTNQDAVDPVFFSTELDDIVSAVYAYDSENYRNVALIGGQIDDETEIRTYAAIEGEAAGTERRELFVDARDMSMSNGEEVLTAEEYEAALINRGRSKLADHRCAESFEVDVLTVGSTYVYGTDFFLGDTITVSDERLGVRIDAVVTAVMRSVSRTGETMSFTLGYSAPTIQKYIRKAVN